MIDILFRQAASDAGWGDAAQVDVLLRYAARIGTATTLSTFLDRERHPAVNENDAFVDAVIAVIAVLRDPGLDLDPSFHRYCAGCRDLFTPRQAAERWCRWRVA